MKKAKVEGIFPLNFLQQALLFHSLQEKNDQGFLQVQCVLNGEINLKSFKKSWEQVIQRHESLRTSIHWENIEKPVQVIHKEVDLPFRFYDWSKFSEHELKEKFDALKKSDAQERLDLSNAPILRVSLIKLTDEKHFLLWSCHHILADGWSASIILQDLVTFYESDKNDKKTSLPTIPSYKSYLNWLKQQSKEKAEVFWTEVFTDFENPTLLAGKKDFAVEAENPFHFEFFKLDEEESHKLRNFSQENQVTLNTLIQGIWSILLKSYTKQDEIVFGTIVSGRSINLPNAELMTGMLMNVLPLRINFKNVQSLTSWLKNIQTQLAKMREFEFVSFDEILSWNPLLKGQTPFDSLLIFENMPLESLDNKGIEIEDFKSGLTSNYPVTFAVNPKREIEFYLKFDSSKISPKSVEWFAENLKVILRFFVGGKAESVEKVLNSLSAFEENERNSDKNQIHFAEGYVAPRNDLELKLLSIWEILLKRESIGVTDDFFEIGGTSFVAIRLFSEIEKQFGRRLQPISLLENRTIESLAKIINEESVAENWSSLVPLRASGSKTPLFCFHAGGGYVFFYKDLAKNLDDEQPVYALQLLGLNDLEAAAKDIESMADAYLKEMLEVRPKGPYALLGTCFSNPICLEIANRLNEMGETVSLLAIIDSPPNYLIKYTPQKRIERLKEMVKNNDWSFIQGGLRKRFIDPIKQKWGYLNSNRQERDFMVLSNLLLEMAAKYVWKPYSGKITLIRSQQFHEAAEEDYHVSDWQTLAQGGLDVHIVSAGHTTIFQEPEVKGLAKQLEKCLDEAK